MGSGRLTTAPEVVAYLAAHIFGLVVVYLLSPIIFRALVVSGQQASIQIAAVSISLLTMLAVMLLFFIARKVLAGESL